MQPLVVELLHRLDAAHEPGELLELGPLVVRGADRNVHGDGLLDFRHIALLAALPDNVSQSQHCTSSAISGPIRASERARSGRPRPRPRVALAWAATARAARAGS